MKQHNLEYDYFVVLDFEASCEKEKSRQFVQEIIEFPSVVVDVASRKVISSWREYVRPVKKPTLSAFCTELTGITQETVDGADIFENVFKRYQKWLYETVGDKSFTFITCGDWDLKVMLPAQLRLDKLEAPSCFRKWINLKTPFSKATGLPPRGMVGMLNHYKIKLEGRHHSGLDDCTNIAAIVITMLNKNVFSTDTSTLPTKTPPQRRGDWTCFCGTLNVRSGTCSACGSPCRKR
eukprot:TRINITY_DN1304_c0_g1_i2.p1 TRINITY_DN1304_c0_g1~~TRINITY_DN1304_c0_g1_i2.p1  ORF type:complete len:265 (-),score=25.80 TRINITY_DN1304_c0_g1_i2:65-772(-)